MERFTFQDRLMNKATDAIFEWAERYLSSVCDDNAGIVSVTGSDHFILRYQLIFISNYVLMMQIGNEISQIERIKRFLDNQRPGDDGKLMEFRFIDGIPCEVYLLAESLDDIDIADIYGVTKFTTMIIYRNDGKDWKKKDINLIIKKTREDLEFDGYDPEIEIPYDSSDEELYAAITMKNEIFLAMMRTRPIDEERFEYMLLTLAGSSDPRVRSMIAGMMIKKEIVQFLEKDKDPGVLLNLVSNLFAFVNLSDRSIKKILKTLLKSKILHEDANLNFVMIAKRLNFTKMFKAVGKYNEEEMERWRETWERNTKVLPIYQKLKEVVDSYDFSDDDGLDLIWRLEERIEDLGYILEGESAEA